MVKKLLGIAGIPVIIFLLQACEPKQQCKPPIGHWTDNEGREMVFQTDGKGIWLTRFGSQYDTLNFTFQSDCTVSPAVLEMQGFTTGPYTGKTLFAIFEWSSDSTFRMQFDDVERPAIFDSQRAARFETKKNGD